MAAVVEEVEVVAVEAAEVEEDLPREELEEVIMVLIPNLILQSSFVILFPLSKFLPSCKEMVNKKCFEKYIPIQFLFKSFFIILLKNLIKIK